MRLYVRVASIFALIAGLSGCAGSVPIPEFYIARYNSGLVEVARSPSTKQRYGKSEAIAVGDSSRYTFEDGLAVIRVVALDRAVSLDVHNKTDHSIKLLWDEASFIDLDGKLSRVMHIGVKYADRNSSQPPTVIPAHQHLADDVFPTDRVYYREAHRSRPAGWHNGSLLSPVTMEVAAGAEGPPSAAADSFKTAVHARIGKRFGVLIPLQVEGVTNEYTFWFAVKDATVIP